MKSSSSIFLTRVISTIDKKLQKQVNIILHHPAFSELESRWRGLHFLVCDVPKSAHRLLQVRLFLINERELRHDLESTTEVEQTVLFHKIYTEEYDQPGGTPFGTLLADFMVSLNEEIDWVNLLSMLSKIAASVFAPIFLGMSAQFFDLNSYIELTDDIDLSQSFRQKHYQRFHLLRQQEDVRFLFLVLPRVLWRLPYQHHERYLANHGFHETLNTLQDYCWGSPIYLIATMMTRCFMQTGWFIQLRAETVSLPFLYPSSDTQQQSPISRLEACISEKLEQTLSNLGFMALTENPYVYAISLRSCHAIQGLTTYPNDVTNFNADIATLLPYLLCACRFAHYIKIIAREKIGSFIDAAACEQYLQGWIFNYCDQTNADNVQQWTRHPLSDARIRVENASGQPEKWICKMELKPNYHIEKIHTKFRFISFLKNER